LPPYGSASAGTYGTGLVSDRSAGLGTRSLLGIGPMLPRALEVKMLRDYYHGSRPRSGARTLIMPSEPL
jgi:hypothetical protein